MALGLVLHFVTGCVAGEGETESWVDGDPVLAEETTFDDLGAEIDAERAAPTVDDEALCASLEDHHSRCRGGYLPAADACPARFACSRKMWRQDAVDDVYACIERASCDEPDPATSCLQEVATELEPTPAERRAERGIAELEDACPGVLEVAPAQSDRVYETITACIETEETCDGIGTCVVLSLEALADDICGPPLETL